MTQLDILWNGKEISLLNIYFPNGGPRADGTEMLSYKLDFYEKYRNHINGLRNNGKLIISTGDFNICHEAIDIARPKENKNSIGFLPIERAEMDKLVNDHYVDVFRHFNPELKDKYTRRSYRAGARQRNLGRRLDYFRVSDTLLPFISKVQHQEAVEGSDHCPILLEMHE
jgi:exodeoxyribonuclease-3